MMHALHSTRSCARPPTELWTCSRQHRSATVSVQAVKAEPSSPWQDVRQQFKGMVQPPAGAQAPTVDKPKPSKQTVSKPGKPKSSTPVKAKPVKATQTAGQRSATQPAAVKPSKPPATASKQQQQKTAPSKSPQKLRDWPQVDPMDVDDMQPSTSGRPPAAAAAPTAPVAGGAAITTGRGFGRAAPAAEPDAEGAPQRLRLFAYAVESKRVMAALQECGLDHRFVFTPDLKQAQAIVSCKMTPGGKTQNIAQGERAAVRAGIPFVVLGRVVTKTTVGRALKPLLQNPGGSSSSSSDVSSSSSAGGDSNSSSSSRSQQSMSDLAAQWHAMGAARDAGY